MQQHSKSKFSSQSQNYLKFYHNILSEYSALSQLHAVALAENRRSYSLSALLPINDCSKQLVVLNLLKHGKQRQPELEWQLIQAVAQILPFNRTLNLFAELQQQGINNARTRRLGNWLWQRYGNAFRVIKYRSKFRTILRHCLASAIASRPDLVLILSDGYENISAGSVAQILNTNAVKNSGIAIIHLNPVAGAEARGVRRLADGIPTFGISLPEQFPLVALLGQAYTQPSILERFFDRIEQALKGGDYSARFANGTSPNRNRHGQSLSLR